jgi:hypothetical protein
MVLLVLKDKEEEVKDMVKISFPCSSEVEEVEADALDLRKVKILSTKSRQIFRTCTMERPLDWPSTETNCVKSVKAEVEKLVLNEIVATVMVEVSVCNCAKLALEWCNKSKALAHLAKAQEKLLTRKISANLAKARKLTGTEKSWRLSLRKE